MYKPNILVHQQLPPNNLQKRERYLPTAFDDSLSIIEKINKVIHYLNDYAQLTEEMLVKWNEVYHWLMNEGLDTSIGDRLREWLEDGTFNDIINVEIFGELNEKIDNVINDFESFKEFIEVEFDKKIQEFKEDIETLIQLFKDEFDEIGRITFNRR